MILLMFLWRNSQEELTKKEGEDPPWEWVNFYTGDQDIIAEENVVLLAFASYSWESLSLLLPFSLQNFKSPESLKNCDSGGIL